MERQRQSKRKPAIMGNRPPVIPKTGPEESRAQFERAEAAVAASKQRAAERAGSTALSEMMTPAEEPVDTVVVSMDSHTPRVVICEGGLGTEQYA
jgi:hypothetical protein